MDRDTPASLARDMIADAGRANALRWLASELLDQRTWRGRAQVVRLIAAVLVA